MVKFAALPQGVQWDAADSTIYVSSFMSLIGLTVAVGEGHRCICSCCCLPLQILRCGGVLGMLNCVANPVQQVN